MGHIRHRINYLKDGKNDKMLMVEHIMSIMLPEQRNGNVPQCEYFSSFPVNMFSVPSMDDLWNDWIDEKAWLKTRFRLIRNSTREAEIRQLAATEFHRRFHISVDETEGQGNQVILCGLIWIRDESILNNIVHEIFNKSFPPYNFYRYLLHDFDWFYTHLF